LLKLPNVTLVAVTSIKLPETIRAITESTKGIEFGAVKLIVGKDAPGIIYPKTVIDYEFDSLDAYSKFIVYNLHEFIDTEFALIIQYDGYIKNHEAWRDEFLDNDYIGAPWSLPSDSFSYRDAFGNIVRVGNGGFSLRSKKLLELPTNLSMPWEPFHGYYNEDGFFTCKNRHIFLENGFKYAPIEVAKYFSIEKDIPENQGITTFGFHGKDRM